LLILAFFLAVVSSRGMCWLSNASPKYRQPCVTCFTDFELSSRPRDL
jgi:hypothetical protein